MNEQKWFDQLNARAEINYRKYKARSQARRTAKLRLHNRLIALNMSLVGVMGMAVGVLIMYIA